ncbi:MAG: XRE family transcriptional regulator [Balneolaceae bacterium]|nr:XRE family transcriptional regulator [Balneolaceae bacterium]
MATVRENINPSVLTFSRERMGYDIPVIAKKLAVNEERWLKWEQGEEKPTTNQLIKIADKLDRTPAYFYLETVPEEEEPLSEFRTINNLALESTSPKLISAIREARRNREELVSLYRSLNQSPEKIPEYEVGEKQISVMAKEVRDWLDVSFDLQRSWNSSSNALTEWKNLLEERDIYVLQFPYVEVSECRGFAIADTPFPVIGINSKDSYNARIFTLIHELAHVLFRNSVLINDSLTNYFGSNRSLEQSCNRLAAEILVPEDLLKNEFNRSDFSVKEVKRVSNRFRVSGYVMMIRLKKCGLISESEYDVLLPEFSFYDSSGSGGSGGNPYYNRIVQKGRLYLKAAFQNYFNEQITVAELANLTGWKVPNLNELAAKTFGWPEEGNYV